MKYTKELLHILTALLITLCRESHQNR